MNPIDSTRQPLGGGCQMDVMTQRKIPAVLMRGGTSKGLFFRADALPQNAQQCNQLLLRAIGSPDPYGKQIDGVGGGTSSTSKIVIVGKSDQADCDVDYLFGHVAIGDALIDYSGNCGNLTAAVGAFAIEERLLPATEGMTTVRIWQANIDKKIIAHVPVRNGEVVVEDDFNFDGVAFPGAEIKLEFLDPAGGSSGKLFPTGNKTDTLDIPEIGKLKVTLIDAGNPTVFLKAKDLDLTGLELQDEINSQPKLLHKLEQIRAHAAVAMGLAETPEQASRERPATPKISFVAKPADYVSSAGKAISKADYDLAARIVSMGKLHHAYTGTGAIALVVAASVTGTVVSQTLGKALPAERSLNFGQPSGLTRMAAEVSGKGNDWQVAKVVMSRSARRLMEGNVLVPQAPTPMAIPAPATADTPNVWDETSSDAECAEAVASDDRKPRNKRRRKSKKKGDESQVSDPTTSTSPANNLVKDQPAAVEFAEPSDNTPEPASSDAPRRRRRRPTKSGSNAQVAAASTPEAAPAASADVEVDGNRSHGGEKNGAPRRRRRRKPKSANGNVTD